MRNYHKIKDLSVIVILNLTMLAGIILYFVSPVLAETGNPVIISTNPADKQEGVDVNLPIYITFDRDMDAVTMTSTNITLQDSLAQNIPARGIHYDSISKTTVFIPLAPLKQDETYQITIKTGVQDINALPLLEDYIVSFKTTSSSTSPEPLVTATIPKESVSKIGTKRVISASFNHDMDPNTLNNLAFVVVDQDLNSVSSETITYDSSSRIAAFVPVSPLISNTQYTVTLKGGTSGSVIKDSAGVSLAKDYSWSFTTGNTEFNDPHGNYMQNTKICSTCHQTHNALNTSLLNKSTETALCFTCHDGSGSNYNVNAGMNETTNQSFHPIMDTGNLQSEQLFQCSDCHDPHGNKDAQGNYYAKLLKITDGTITVNQGNEFCLICHGTSDRKFTDAYYANTAGDHSNTIAAHYDTVNPALLPASGTKITCSKCHTSHSGKYNQLTDQQEENLCLSCHNNQANSLNNKNIQEEFFGSPTKTIISTHDLTSANNGKVECSSCHGSHTVGAASLSEGKMFSDLSDPQNTKNVFTTVAGTPNATVGNMTDFCLRCHGGTPPVATSSLTQVVPFNVVFPQTTFINSGWNKTNYTSSKHYTSGEGCEACHEPHGSQYPSLQSRGEDINSTSGDGECLSCHANVGQALDQTSHHPTLEISGKHKDAETAADKLSSGNRHAECVDCHDPHSGSPTMQSGNNLCLDCHTMTTNGSGFAKEPGSENLHISKDQHKTADCNACHVTVPHGSSNPKLLSTTAIDNNSKVTLLSGSTNLWTKESCGTVTGCH